MNPPAEFRADTPAAAASAGAKGLGLARVLPVFSLVYAAVYFFGVYTNLGPIRYYPALGQITLTPLPAATAGPVMMWYGWVFNAALAGALAASLALLAPPSLLAVVWVKWAWTVVAFPAALLVLISLLLREYFI